VETLEQPTVLIHGHNVRPYQVAVLIPAHNEAEQIGHTLDSLFSQTRRPDFILVISDNSTDNTIECARAKGVHVIQTQGNIHKKAGALNTGIEFLLSLPAFPEFVVTIDADTSLESHFIERALTIMKNTPRLGGLSAVCRGKDNLGASPLQKALAWYQRAEYTRAGFVRIRRNVHTLSGAGTMMRSHAILDVLSERPHLYELRETNIVEDFEATLEIKRHGWKCTNNYHTVAFTDLMVTPKTLLRQRLRWVGGTIDELRRRGWKRETRASIVTVIYGFLGIPIYYIWLYFLWFNLHNGADLRDIWFLFCVATFQAVTLTKMGWKSMIIGFLILPEVLYMLFRHTWLSASVVRSYITTRRDWD
jgi:cellulose synthase/poly-beta-1,6-N-acetylglucosamine synthase-like glycosyltransferase